MRKWKMMVCVAALGLATGLVAQQAPKVFEALPGVEWEYLGEGWYRSPLFGDFYADANSPYRFRSKTLGWLTVAGYEEESGKIFLKTDDHGMVWTVLEWCEPGVGRNVHSVLNDTTFMVLFDVEEGQMPFFNRKTETYQDAIIHSLWDYRSYYQDAYNYTVATQTVAGQMQGLLVKHTGTTEDAASEAIAAEMESVFLDLQANWEKFQFFFWRTVNTPFFARTDLEREAATSQVRNAENLAGICQTAFVLGQQVLQHSRTYSQQVKQADEVRKQQEAAAAAAAAAAANNGSSGSSSGSSSRPSGGSSSGGGSTVPPPSGGYSSSTNAGTDWYSAKIVGPVAGDVFSWRQTITLHSVGFSASPVGGRVSVLFPSTKPTRWDVKNIAVPTRQNPNPAPSYSVGNWWLIQNVNGTYYATTMDYFRPDQFRNDWAPAVFWQHLSNGYLYPPYDKYGKGKSTPEVAPMVYRKGETYGLMVTTLARQQWRTSNERSNIVLFTMP